MSGGALPAECILTSLMLFPQESRVGSSRHRCAETVGLRERDASGEDSESRIVAWGTSLVVTTIQLCYEWFLSFPD